jgi:hypothetical protein
MPDVDKPKRNILSVAVTDEARKHLDNLAQTRATQTGANFYASDIVREAIQEYLANRGIQIEVKVNRGGYRQRSSEDEE